jgi:hypothetical protein
MHSPHRKPAKNSKQIIKQYYYKTISVHQQGPGSSSLTLFYAPSVYQQWLVIKGILSSLPQSLPGVCWDHDHLCTDKKENKIFLIYKEIQMGAVVKSYCI